MMNNKEDQKKPQEENEITADAEEATAGERANLETDEERETDEKEEPGDEAEIFNIKLAEAKDKYLRIYSEFENFRRRTAKEKIETIAMANAGLIQDLLPVMDDFDRALQAANEEKATLESVKEGMDLIHQKLNKVLEVKGLKPMEVGKGDAFDDDFHEAGDEMEGKIVDVVETGYFLNDKVVRFAKVVTGAKQ